MKEYRKGMFETRIRIDHQSKLSEIVATALFLFFGPTIYRKADSRNSNQNRKAVETERDGRYHTNFKR